jgi:Glycosyl hydrolase family 9
VLPTTNRVPWRGDSGLSDWLANGTEGVRLVRLLPRLLCASVPLGSAPGHDASIAVQSLTVSFSDLLNSELMSGAWLLQVGGYYDTGVSFVKYTYPMATTTALLSWGLLAFPKVCGLRAPLNGRAVQVVSVALVLTIEQTCIDRRLMERARYASTASLTFWWCYQTTGV